MPRMARKARIIPARNPWSLGPGGGPRGDALMKVPVRQQVLTGCRTLTAFPGSSMTTEVNIWLLVNLMIALLPE
jgi:hypothetical protein